MSEACPGCGQIMEHGFLQTGGGTAAFYASCVLPEITRTIASCSVCTFGDSIMAMEHCSCNFIPPYSPVF